MKKLSLILIALILLPTLAFAGSLTENTNRSVSYLRMVARGTSFAPDAVYFNPAGAGFMEDGWHIDFSIQQAIQKRTTQSTFACYAQNINNLGESTKEYVGNTFAPVIPNLNLVWKKNKWAVLVNAGISGGGGVVDYSDGLGSFETAVSQVPTLLTSMGLPTTMYGMNMNLKATSFRINATVGAAYQILPCLSVSLQASVNFLTANYEGGLSNIEINPYHPLVNPSSAMINAAGFFNTIGAPEYAAMVADQKLDVKQKGISISPIIGLCFHKNGWTASAKYAFKAAMTTKNETKSDINGLFPDGGTQNDDMPAQLALAGGYDFGKVRLTAEWHHYWDKQARNSFSDEVRGATNEYLAGVEVNVSKSVALSCGFQRCIYNMDIQEYDDDNFDLSSSCIGIGGQVRVSNVVKLEAGILFTIYDNDSKVDTQLGKTDVFKRNSLVYGIGASFRF